MEKEQFTDQPADSELTAPKSASMADAVAVSPSVPAPGTDAAPVPPSAPAVGVTEVPRRRLRRIGRRPRIRPIHIHVRVHTLDSFRYRDYRFFWLSTFLISGGTWVHELVIGWLTYDLTRSPLLTSLALGLVALPYLLVAPVGGMFADRFDRRKLLVAGALYQAALTAGFSALVVSGVAETWHIFAFVLGVGVSWAIQDPTRVAMLSSVVPRQNLVNAFALTGLAFNVTRLVVPALAGLLIAVIGPGRTLYLASALFLAAAAAVMAMELARKGQPEAGRERAYKQFLQGARYVRKEPLVLTLILLGAVPILVVFPFIHGLLPVYAAEVFDVGPAGLGLMVSALGVGATVGTVVLASLGDVAHKGRYALLGLAVVVASVVFFSLSSSFMSPLPVLMVLAGALTMVFTINGVMLQSILPDSLRGRVTSLSVMTWGLMPVASALSGGLAGLFGAPSATLIAGITVAVLLGALAPKLRRVWEFNEGQQGGPSSD